MNSLLLFRPVFAFLAMAAWCAFAEAQTQDPNTADASRFDVFEYRIVGNSKLADQDIERAVMPFLGEERTLVEVDAARAALEKIYHDAGWLTVTVSIPEQKVDEGEITLQVIEGEVGKLRVKGAKYHANADIRATVPELAEGNVPNFPRMQAELAELNRSADLRVAPVMTAGKVPGTVDVRLETEDELPLHGTLEYNNWQAPNGTPTHLGMNLRYDNLWQIGHSISLTAIVTPEKYDESSQYALTYVVPLGRGGDALALYAVRSRSKYDTITGSPGLGVVGNVNIFGLRHALTLPRLEDFSQSFNYGIDYKDVLQSVSVSASEGLATPITYAPLAASYSANWLGEGRTTTLAASTVVGLGGVFGNKDAEFANKRSGASASFMTVKGSLQHIETLGRWSLEGKIETQLASGPLVSNEQYFAGGADSVRGYLEGELTGDAGVRMAVQVTTPTLTMGSSTSPWRVAGVAFYEGARLRTLEPVYPQPAYQTIRGTGLGLRLSGAYATQLSLDLAKAIDQGITTQAGDYRFYARLLMNF